MNAVEKAVAGLLSAREARELLSSIATLGASMPLSKVQRIAASISPDLFTNVLTSEITARLVEIYHDFKPDYQDWTVRTSSDYLDTQYIEVVESLGMADILNTTGGEFHVVHPSDGTEGSFEIEGFGKIFEADLRTIRSDRLGWFSKVTQRLARMMVSRLHNYIYVTQLQSNPTVYDGNSLFDDTNHANDFSGASTYKAPNYANVLSCIEKADAMTDGQSEPVSSDQFYIVSGYRGWESLEQLANNENRPNDANRDFNVIRKRLKGVILSRKLGYDWYLIADPKELPGLELCFFEGKEEPNVTAEKTDSSYQFLRPGNQRWRVDMWMGAVWQSFYAAIRGSSNTAPS